MAGRNTGVGPTGKQFDEIKEHFVLSGDEVCVSLMPSGASAGLFLQGGLGGSLHVVSTNLLGGPKLLVACPPQREAPQNKQTGHTRRPAGLQ